MTTAPRATHDEERGPRTTVPGPTVYDQDDPIVGASGLPVVESMPPRGVQADPARAPGPAQAAHPRATHAGRSPSEDDDLRRVDDPAVAGLGVDGPGGHQSRPRADARKPADRVGPRPRRRRHRDLGREHLVHLARAAQGRQTRGRRHPEADVVVPGLDRARGHRPGPPARPGGHRAVRLDPHPR